MDLRVNVPALGPNPLAFDFSIGIAGNGESLQEKYSRLEQQTHQLANKIKQSKSPSESDRNELQAAVRKSFEARQALQHAEIADLAQRLRGMQQSIEMRERLAEKIIERRVTDLLNPDLKWDVGPAVATGTTANVSQDKLDKMPESTNQVESMKQKVQGRWIVENMQSDDTYKNFRGRELLIKEDLLTYGSDTIDMQWRGLATRPHGNASTCVIDYVYEPNGAQLVAPGIISCDGDTLKICYSIAAFAGDANREWRPERFIPGSKALLIECRRAQAPICTAPEPLAGRSTESSELNRPSISGRWKINSYSEESLEVKDGEYGELIIASGELCLVNPQKTIEVCTWEFDQQSIQPDMYTNKTCPINIVIENGPACPGIIRLEGDRLRICFSTHELSFHDPEKYRPTEFRPGLKVAFLDCSRVTPNPSEIGDYNKALNQL